MPDVAARIQDIEVGERIWARDLVTRQERTAAVTGLFNKQTDELMTITVNSEQVAVTSEHPFYVAGRGCVQSGSLKRGR